MKSSDIVSNNKVAKTAITPTRAENYAEWYQQVIKAADLAEVAPVRGCMIIKPWGYAIWENIQHVLDGQFKATGHKNLYFPLMIPLSFLQKEAEHIEGFAKECAVVTHHRLSTNAQGQLIPAPDSALEEPYIIRPTSEAIIGDAFARWVQSYRDLPLLVNQWANIVRWEMRTRLFLRTTEFLWQEGHTAHATAQEAMQESLSMLDLYARFAKEYLALPVICGEKTESERFPGAVNTYCIEAMMQDKKALQAGTSHFLGQHFSRGFNIQYLSAEGRQEFAWTTSWGVSTRLIGGLIMAHSDDNGLVLPPRIAPAHVVLLPIIRQDADQANILAYCETLAKDLRQISYHGEPLRVEVDARQLSGGEKVWSWIKKGIPLRIEIGSKECAANTTFVGRRDKEHKDRRTIARTALLEMITTELDDMQAQLWQRAWMFQQQNIVTMTSQADFNDFFAKENGFVLAHWNGDAGIEAKIKQELGVTIRCKPFDKKNEKGTCIFTGEPSAQPVIFAKAY